MTRLLSACVLVVVVVLGGASAAVAGPRSILVLPLGGTADAATRAAFDASVEKLARGLGGAVTTGDTTFEETAAAVGCDPADPACADTVRTTLGVDELVYGTATTTGGQTTIVLRRAASEAPPRETTATANSAAAAEPALAPLFAPPADPGAAPLPAPPPVDHHRRNVGIAYVAGGGAALIVGLALWSSASHRQDQIDAHRADTAQDFAELEALERKTLEYAVIGDILVVGGLALGTWGGWVLYKDSEARQLSIAPAVEHAGGGVTGITLRGAW